MIKWIILGIVVLLYIIFECIFPPKCDKCGTILEKHPIGLGNEWFYVCKCKNNNNVLK